MGRTVSIKKFKPQSMVANPTAFVVGNKSCGKTCLVQNLLYHIPADPSSISSISAITPSLAASLTKKQSARNKTHTLVMDGQITSADLTEPTTATMFLNSLSLKLGIILAIPYNQFPQNSQCVENADYMFIFKPSSVSELQDVYDTYYHRFKSSLTVDDLYEIVCGISMCEPFACLVVDLSERSSNMDRMLYWYKADIDSSIEVELSG